MGQNRPKQKLLKPPHANVSIVFLRGYARQTYDLFLRPLSPNHSPVSIEGVGFEVLSLQVPVLGFRGFAPASPDPTGASADILVYEGQKRICVRIGSLRVLVPSTAP